MKHHNRVIRLKEKQSAYDKEILDDKTGLLEKSTTRPGSINKP